MALSKIEAPALDVGQIGGRRNLIINGAMQVAQRGTSFASPSNGAYTVDRFKYSNSNLGAWTIEQSSDAPDGFMNSLKWTCTTADASPSAADYVRIIYSFEGNDVQQFAYGTSSAKDMTVSFWVKSSKTGVFVLNLRNNSQTKKVERAITINSANTWEYKTVTISGDTAVAFDTGTDAELNFEIWLDAGSNYSSTALNENWSTTVSTNYYTGGTLNLGSAINNTFQITGVQLEVGSVSTPFEHRSYGEELALCQRYYEKFVVNGGTSFTMGTNQFGSGCQEQFNFSAEKRVTPTLSSSGGNWSSFNVYNGSNQTGLSSVITASTAKYFSFWVQSLGAYSVHFVYNNGADWTVEADAEL